MMKFLNTVYHFKYARKAIFDIWVYVSTFEIKNEYCSIKDAERIVFTVLGAVKPMRFSCRN